MSKRVHAASLRAGRKPSRRGSIKGPWGEGGCTGTQEALYDNIRAKKKRGPGSGGDVHRRDLKIGRKSLKAGPEEKNPGRKKHTEV